MRPTWRGPLLPEEIVTEPQVAVDEPSGKLAKCGEVLACFPLRALFADAAGKRQDVPKCTLG